MNAGFSARPHVAPTVDISLRSWGGLPIHISRRRHPEASRARTVQKISHESCRDFALGLVERDTAAELAGCRHGDRLAPHDHLVSAA